MSIRSRLHRMGLVLGMFLLGAPLAAQSPGHDPAVERGRLEELIGRTTEWYLTATKWRDATVARGNAMLQQTQRVIQLRQKYEDMSTGELGILGGKVPKWSNYANMCHMAAPSGSAAAGVTVCNVNSFLQDQYEGVMGQTLHRFQDPLFSAAPALENTIMTDFGHAGQSATAFAASNSHSIFASSTARVPMAIERGQDAAMLDAVAVQMNALIDTLETSETHGQPLSSNQAVQLQSYVDIAKARGSLSRLQNQLSWLRSTAIEAGETVASDRQGPSTSMQVRF